MPVIQVSFTPIPSLFYPCNRSLLTLLHTSGESVVPVTFMSKPNTFFLIHFFLILFSPGECLIHLFFQVSVLYR